MAGQRARIAQRAGTRGGVVPWRFRITVRDLPASLRSGGAVSQQPLLAQNDLTVEEAEKKQLIIRALKEAGGNRTAAAAKVGMSRRTLHRKLHAYHLEGN